MIQRGGAVVIRMLENVQQRTGKPLIQATIAPGTCVYTDEYDIYSRLEPGAMRMQASVTAVANRRGMMTAMAVMK